MKLNKEEMLITIDYSTGIDKSAFNVIIFNGLNVFLEDLEHLKITEGADIDSEILEIQEQIKQIIKGE
jgi:hypothetical protein